MARDEFSPLIQATQIGLGGVPSFDIGFQSGEANQIEHALGLAAINAETVHDAMTNQIDKYLNQAYTNASLVQTSLTDNVYNHLQQAQSNANIIHNALEASLAGQMGMPLESAQLVAPSNIFVQSFGPAGKGPPIKPAVGQTFGIPIAQVAGNCVFVDNTGREWSNTEVSAWFQNMSGTGLPKMYIPNPDGPGTILDPKAVQISAQIIADQFFALTGIQATVVPNGAIADANSMLLPYNNIGIQAAYQAYLYRVPCGPSTPINPPPPYIPPPPYVPPSQPTNCCPPIKFPDCIKICDVTPKKCEEPVYQVYCDDNTGLLTVVLRSDTSNTTPGTLLDEGIASSIDWKRVCDNCGAGNPIDVPLPPPPPPPQWGFGGACDNLFNFPQLVNPQGMNTFKFIGEKIVESFEQEDPEFKNSLIGQFAKMILEFAPAIGSGADAIGSLIGEYLAGGQCGGANVGGMVSTRALLGLFGKFVGNAVEPMDRQVEYALNEACQYVLPTAEDATRQYLTDSISLDRLKCLVKANGKLWIPWEATVDSNRTRWNAAETLMLWRREEITAQQADDYLRQLGYLSAKERAGLTKLTEQVPAVSDLMTMMMRDVADEINVDWKSSDKIFVDKWAGQIKKWGDFQGIPEEMAKYIWRAHWQIPSPTQLFEFWHRLRNGGMFGNKKDFYEKIKGALIQQDILPDWIDAYLEVSFKPLTRVDAKRAYSIGVLDEQALTQAFLDQGYSDDNAKVMVDFTKKQASVAAQKSPYVKRYAKGELSESTLRTLLFDDGLNSELADEVVLRAKKELSLGTVKACVSSVQKRYMLGEIKDNEIGSNLAELGLDADQVVQLSKAWGCIKSSRGKTIPATTLCGWYQQGSIDEVSLYTRLVNLGYSQDDAASLTRDCMIRNGLKLDKEKQQKLKQQAVQDRQSAAASRRAAKELTSIYNKQIASIEKAQSVQQKRQKKIIDISEVWAKKTGDKLSDSVVAIKAMINRAYAMNLAPFNVILGAADDAAKDGNITTIPDLIEAVTKILIDVTV